jgi:hypothetical protein
LDQGAAGILRENKAHEKKAREKSGRVRGADGFDAQ